MPPTLSHSLPAPIALPMACSVAWESSTAAFFLLIFLQSVCRFYFLSKCSLHQLFLHPNCHCPIKATKNPLLLALPASASPCLSNLHASHQNCHSCQVTPLLKNFQSFPPARTCPHCLSICTHLAFHGLTDSGGSLPGLISHFTIIPRTLLGATHTAPPPVPQFSHLPLKYSSSSSLPV